MAHEHDYDVAVTFAGEDRNFVERVVREVTDAGFRVFYDQDEQVTLWGEDLTEYFPEVYEKRSRFAVMFISRDYAAKPWTRLERRSVLVRALNQKEPYLLPVRLDDTVLEGVRESVSYLDGRRVGHSGVSQAICEKLGRKSDQSPSTGRFNGRVPRTPEEATVVIGERPPAWEYLIFSHALVDGMERLAADRRDLELGFANPSRYIEDSEVGHLAKRELAIIERAISNITGVFDPETQVLAFGEPGEPGDLDLILHLAERFGSTCKFILDWARQIRSIATESDEALELLQSLALTARDPVRQMVDFAYTLRDQTDEATTRLAANEPATIQITLTVNLPEDVQARMNRAFDAFYSHMRSRR